jgi:hypothetical protein
MPTKWDKLREENIARNKKLLASLREKDAAGGVLGPQPRAVGRKSALKKKRMQRTSDDEIEDFRPIKRARPEIPQSGLRRSQRNAGKEIPDYQGESQERLPRLVTARVGVDHDGDPRRPSGKRIHDPYV